VVGADDALVLQAEAIPFTVLMGLRFRSQMCTKMSGTPECVKQGTKHALVAGKKVYTLEGHEVELDKVVGMKATVKGKVSGDDG
jgi:hypothetical protein